MSLNNIDSQFAITRSEIRAMLQHVDGNTLAGKIATGDLKSMLDILDTVQDNQRSNLDCFHRFPVKRTLDRWGDPETREDAAALSKWADGFSSLDK